MSLAHDSRKAFTILGLNFDINMGRGDLCRNVYNKIWKVGFVPNGDVSNLRVAWKTCNATWDSENLTLHNLRIISTCLYRSRFEQSKYLKIRHVITWASRLVPKGRNAWPEPWSHQSPIICVGQQQKFKNVICHSYKYFQYSTANVSFCNATIRTIVPENNYKQASVTVSH